jgi:hypothetical protein
VDAGLIDQPDHAQDHIGVVSFLVVLVQRDIPEAVWEVPQAQQPRAVPAVQLPERHVDDLISQAHAVLDNEVFNDAQPRTLAEVMQKPNDHASTVRQLAELVLEIALLLKLHHLRKLCSADDAQLDYYWFSTLNSVVSSGRSLAVCRLCMPGIIGRVAGISLVDLLTQDSHVLGSLKTESHPVAFYIEDTQRYVIADEDPLVDPSCQYQHVGLSLWENAFVP